MSLMMLCYLISSFFSRAKTAGLLGILIIFLTFVPIVLCMFLHLSYHSLVYSNSSRTLLLSLSIDATIAFSLGFSYFSLFISRHSTYC